MPSDALPPSAFGPNEWLVDEIYQQYLADRDSVDPAWWDFFADYRPTEHGVAAGAGPVEVSPAPEATPAPAGPTPAPDGSTVAALRGPAARVVANMEASLAVPTATSVRSVPAKLLIDNRIVINNHLARGRGGKVSFTHLIGFALVRALGDLPEMNWAYTQADGKPAVFLADRGPAQSPLRLSRSRAVYQSGRSG